MIFSFSTGKSHLSKLLSIFTFSGISFQTKLSLTVKSFTQIVHFTRVTTEFQELLSTIKIVHLTAAVKS